MAEVFVESLVIENFGPYYGRHEFKFSGLEERGLILIGAPNGVGKTHLWRAALLALLGESGPSYLRKLEAGEEGAAFQFERSFNRKAAARGENLMRLELTLAQRETGNGSVRRVTLKREVTFRPHSPPRWDSSLPGPDADVKAEEETIQKLRESFVPRHMARFCFLDSERSQSLKLGQEEVVEGVSRVLGLWGYGQTEGSLRYVIQRTIHKEYRCYTTAAATASWLAEISGSVVRVEGQLQAKAKEAEALEAELAECRRELEEAEAGLKQLGAAAPEALKAARQEHEAIVAKRAELEGRLSDAWELAIPVGLLGQFGQEL